jgi:xylose isomerase
MRTYLILKEKAARFNADPEIQQILREVRDQPGNQQRLVFSPEHARRLKAEAADLEAMRGRGLGYERLDQLTTEVLLGVR